MPLVLSGSPAGAGSRRLAWSVGVVSLGIFLALLPFAKTPLAAAHWFIPLNQSVLIINDLVTAVLLFGQLRLTRMPAILVLASAYLFAAAMAIVHLLTFPGVFATGGLLGAGTQSTAYMFVFWHAGFPVGVVAHTLLKSYRPPLAISTAKATVSALLAVAAAVACLSTLAIAGADFLPAMMDGRQYAPGFNAFRYGLWLVTAAALAVQWRRRSRSILDTWLLVVLAACFFEIGLVSIFNAGRYDVGFYAGRVYALLASTLVLLVLLTEQGKLYRDLVLAQETARSELALRESSAVLKLAMEGGRMGAWSRTVDQGTVWYSPELEQLIGVPVGSLAPTSEALVGLIHPDDHETVRAALFKPPSTANELAAEFRLRHSDGRWRWMDARGKVVRDEVGRAVSVSGVLIDVTSRKEAAAATHQIEVRFRTLADGMPQLAWMARPDGWIYWYNRRWYDYTGTTPSDMEGWGWQRVHDPAVLPDVMARWQHSINSGEPFEMVFPLRAADGRFRRFLTRVSPLKDEAGQVQHWLGTNTDITAQYEAEEALRRADQRKDEFLATLAHELRNPLAPIRSCVEILGKVAPLPERAQRAREIIDRQSRHLARLVDDLLEVSRMAQGKVHLRNERISLCDCLRDALEAVNPAIERCGHRLEVDIPNDPLWANGDPTRIAQAFMNLLNNAVKFTRPGGLISVTAHRASGQACIRVADNGIGIDPAHLGGIFEIFAQIAPALQRSQGGLGIGLALVRGFVNLHGGTVEAFSDGVDKGSAFVVTLPLLEREALPLQVPVDAMRAGIRYRVLVIDDNVDAASSLCETLRLAGHDVREAHAGTEGLRMAFQFEPDAVLVDIGMPGMNGFEVARELRMQPIGPRVRLIAVTGWGQDRDRERTREAGFDAHLTKPVDGEELQSVLEQPLFAPQI